MNEIECQSNVINIIPELFLCVVALFLLLVGVTLGNKAQRIINLLTKLALTVTIFILIFVVGIDEQYAFNDFYYSNSFIVFAKVLLLVVALFIFVLNSGEDYPPVSAMRSFEFPVILLLAIIGMMIMISANDFLTLYLGLELQTLCLYILAAFERDNSKSNEAGLKYFVLGSLASGLLLYGISFTYGFTGSTNFEIIEDLFESGVTGESTAVGFIIGLVFVVIGFCFKLSAAPFHMWAPDVYQGSPNIVTTMFATLPKIAAIILLTRVLVEPFSSWVGEWRQLIILVSVLSMFIGAFGAIKQSNIKRLFAYSSIGHVGFMLIGVASANQQGITGLLIYLSLYLTMSLGAFATLFMMKKDAIVNEEISSLKGLSKTNPVMGFIVSLTMLSMAGIPPLAGFYAKFYIFQAALEANLFMLAVAGIVASVISAFYYLRIVKMIYLDEPELKFDESPKAVRFVAATSAVINLLYFLFPSILTNLVLYAVSNM